MTEIKHTPGPWRLDDLSFSVLARGSVDTVNFSVLSRIVTCHELVSFDTDGREWHCSGDRLANARLIAAAPELLDALIQAREHLEWSTPQGQDAMVQIVNAIAKAEGRS